MKGIHENTCSAEINSFDCSHMARLSFLHLFSPIIIPPFPPLGTDGARLSVGEGLGAGEAVGAADLFMPLSCLLFSPIIIPPFPPLGTDGARLSVGEGLGAGEAVGAADLFMPLSCLLFSPIIIPPFPPLGTDGARLSDGEGLGAGEPVGAADLFMPFLSRLFRTCCSEVPAWTVMAIMAAMRRVRNFMVIAMQRQKEQNKKNVASKRV